MFTAAFALARPGQRQMEERAIALAAKGPGERLINVS